MNARQWIQLGYKVILRQRWAYLVKPGEKTVHTIEIENGEWRKFDDLESRPWRRIKIEYLHPQLLDDILSTIRVCYCGPDGVEHCDFCSGRRKPNNEYDRVLVTQEPSREQSVEYCLEFKNLDCPDAGWSFPCDENGKVDVEKLQLAGKENYLSCTSGKGNISKGRVERYVHRWKNPRMGTCYCGEEIELDSFTNTCKCGADYDRSGHRLAPREQWGCETGESLSDILSIR